VCGGGGGGTQGRYRNACEILIRKTGKTPIKMNLEKEFKFAWHNTEMVPLEHCN
jgi:hypothetical protein